MTREPWDELEDRTPDELAAIRALAAELEELLDAPAPGPIVIDEDLEVTRDALPPLAATTAAAPIVRDVPRPPSPPSDAGLADRMRGVLRGVLDRTRKKKKTR